MSYGKRCELASHDYWRRDYCVSGKRALKLSRNHRTKRFMPVSRKAFKRVQFDTSDEINNYINYLFGF